jgi:molybdenum-dependent DNA-binding transcriptional regulator ModE
MIYHTGWEEASMDGKTLFAGFAGTHGNEVKGKSALAISRDLGLSYKAAFVLLHKLREAMAEEMKGRKLGGEGKVAEIDGGYFGGYVKPANHIENRRDRRLARNQTGKRKAVVIIRERNGRSLPAVFRTEGQALSFIRSRIAKGTIINADEGSSWDAPSGRRAALTERSHPVLCWDSPTNGRHAIR